MPTTEPDPTSAVGGPSQRIQIVWWKRLGVRATAVFALVTLASVTVFVAVTLRAQQRYLTSEVLRGAVQFSDTIKASTYHFMLADERIGAYRTMEAIGRLEGIEKVRMLNKEGRVTYSTESREVGQLVDKRAEACYACHAAGQPLVRLNVPSRSRIFQHNGHRVLAMITPIYNEAGCSASDCHAHPKEQQVLGVVDVAMSLAREDAAIESLGRSTLLFGGLGVLALAASVGLFIRGYVIRPLGEMVRATERIAAGDLERRLPVRRSDEIGGLASSFNGMTDSLRQARSELHDLNESLERQVQERTTALRDAQAQLIQSEKMSSLGKLAASVAHEINNPLAGILTYSKLLVRLHEEGEMTDKVRESCTRNLRLVQRETERCSAIVRNLLDFARQRTPMLKELDVSAVAEEALSLLAHRLMMQNVALEKSLPPLPLVRADFGQLRQAFVNIALNACEAMNAGGRLRVVGRQAGQMVELEFADTGPGIPPEHLSRILDPFFTTKEKGTGLGLSVVDGLIDRHGGKLDIQSEVGVGTTVTIRLPIAGAGPPAARGAGGAMETV
ncbi:MAG: HAMP domain-containing protein [Acidobacteria bacterium]|nr:MAG: HAMP domain-containing protein [Acidobacteriota bacterium]